MPVWERFLAERNRPADQISQEQRLIDQRRREREQEEAEKHAAEMARLAAKKAEAMRAFQATNAMAMLNEIAGHIPGALVEIVDTKGDGYLTARVNWQKDVNIVDPYSGKRGIRTENCQISVNYISQATGIRGPMLGVTNLGHLPVEGATNADELEGKLAMALGREMDRTNQTIVASFNPISTGNTD